MVKEIICKHGEIVLVDDEDYQVLSYHKWHFTEHDNRPYVCTKLNNCEGNTRNIYMHNFLVSIDHNPYECVVGSHDFIFTNFSRFCVIFVLPVF